MLKENLTKNDFTGAKGGQSNLTLIFKQLPVIYSGESGGYMLGLSKKEQLQKEMERRKNRRVRLLTAFEQKGVLTTADLRFYGTGVSSRIFELRKAGHKISAVYESPGNYRYIYRGTKWSSGYVSIATNQ